MGQYAQRIRKIAKTRQKSRESTSTSRPRPKRRTTSGNSSSKVRSVGTPWTRETMLTPCLYAELNASTAPYSKSHNRRLRRAARPQNNLVTTLQEVEAVLPSIEPAFDMSDEADAFEVEAEEEEYEEAGTAASGKGKTGGKGKEKLTAKKRQRVLCVPFFQARSCTRSDLFMFSIDRTAESTRLPAIIKNESFAASPFATIRQHTLNTLAMQKNPPVKKAK